VSTAVFQAIPVDPSFWSYDTGYTYCLYSYAAYCPPNSIQSWTCSWCQQNSSVSGFVTTQIVTSLGELAYVGYNKDYQQILAVFRGSTDIVNWINNMDAVLVDYPYCTGCQVHEGFYDTWKSVKVGVMNEVYRLHKLYPSYSIVVSGHSLGAAVATLAGVDIYKNVSSTVYSWTLGSPRVGNPAFADWYTPYSGVVHNQRITNNKDVVPHMPSELEGFRHVPQESWEQKTPVIFILCSATNGEDSHCSDSVLMPDSVYDHLHYFGLYETCS